MDPYLDPDQQPEATLQAMVTRLEERSRHPAFRAFTEDYTATIPCTQPVSVLDLGCGTGAVLRLLEERLHPDSTLTGADISEKILAAARSFSPNSRIHWNKIQPGRLPYGDASFDVLIMHTLLSHVPHTDLLLKEASRVLRPGGSLIVFDADHAATTFAQPDSAKMRELDHRLVSAIATHPDICRQLPRHLKGAGFTLLSHKAHPLSECGKGDFWLSSVRGFAQLIPALGILSKQEGDAWVTHMLQSHEEGTFFAAGIFYTFYAKTAGLDITRPNQNSPGSTIPTESPSHPGRTL